MPEDQRYAYWALPDDVFTDFNETVLKYCTMQERLDEKHAIINKLKKDNTQLMEKYRKELEALRSSASWKLTAPLRKMKSVVSHILKK